MIRNLCFCLIVSVTFSSVAVSNEKPESKDIAILASIKPIKLIIQAIVGDQQSVDVLVPAGMSIHDYALRPSDLTKILGADLILWLGPVWEPYLGKPLKQSGINETEGKVLDISIPSTPDIRAAENPHVWLSPFRAGQIAKQLVDRLVMLHPAGGEQYRQNLSVFLEKLMLLDADLEESLSRGDVSYLVYHDAYALFEAEYGLAHAAVISVNHEINPGAKHLLYLRHVVETQGVGCIIVEPESNMSVVNVVAQGFDMMILSLDPMATNIVPDADAYLNFIRGIGETFRRCVGGVAEK